MKLQHSGPAVPTRAAGPGKQAVAACESNIRLSLATVTRSEMALVYYVNTTNLRAWVTRKRPMSHSRCQALAIVFLLLLSEGCKKTPSAPESAPAAPAQAVPVTPAVPAPSFSAA